MCLVERAVAKKPHLELSITIGVSIHIECFLEGIVGFVHIAGDMVNTCRDIVPSRRRSVKHTERKGLRTSQRISLLPDQQ